MRSILYLLLTSGCLLCGDFVHAQQAPILLNFDGSPKELALDENEKLLLVNGDFKVIYLVDLKTQQANPIPISDFFSLKAARQSGDKVYFELGDDLDKVGEINLVTKTFTKSDWPAQATNLTYNRLLIDVGSNRYKIFDGKLTIIDKNLIKKPEVVTQPVVKEPAVVAVKEGAMDTVALKKKYLASDDFNTNFTLIYEELVQTKKFKEAEFLYEKLAKDFTKITNVYTQLAWCNMFLNKWDDANKYVQYADLSNPGDLSVAAIKSYIAAAKGDFESMNKLIRFIAFTDVQASSYDYLLLDIKDLLDYKILTQENGNKYKTALKTAYDSRSKVYDEAMAVLNSSMDAYGKGDYKTVLKKYRQAQEIISTKAPQEFKYLETIVTWNAASLLIYSNENHPEVDYRAVFENNFKTAFKYDLENARLKFNAGWWYAIYLKGYNDFATAENVLMKSMPYAEKLPSMVFGDDVGEMMNLYCQTLLQQDKVSQLQTWGKKLYDNPSLRFEYQYDINGLNYQGMSYMDSDKQKADSKFKEALKYAEEVGFKDTEIEVKSNMATNYYFMNRKSEAYSLYNEIIAYYRGKKNYQQLEVTLNNTAAFYLGDKNYAKAASLFEEAISTLEYMRSTAEGDNEEGNVLFLQRVISAYQFMAICYAELNRPDKLFETQNLMTARVLAESIGRYDQKIVPKNVSYAQFQSSLAPDEAAIFYTNTKAGEVVIHAVTNSTSKATVVDKTAYWVALKKKWLDRFHRKDPPGSSYKPVRYDPSKTLSTQLNPSDMDEHMDLIRGVVDQSIPTGDDVQKVIFQEYLGGYYDWLIKPVISVIGSKKRLIIFPDGVLNFLPFDALIDENGKYLAQRFEIKFSPSAQVRELLRNRQYSPNRKPFLAMGGAIYEKMEEPPVELSDETKYLELAIEARENAEKGAPQRQVYASIFKSKMNYLPGTLQEVKNLSGIFSNAEVYTGEQMTEAFIKNLSNSGKLKDYRVIHLATHGFAIPQFPQLSGVAMCIFPTMRNNQDGYLTAPEIAQLEMNADLVVLSACETALGKIYGGEGVSGLMQSLLIGGANRALVTLWPVSDQGTMYFMTGLYTLTEKEGKSYEEAINIMKNRFINGEFGEVFKAPQFWAPYVQYGL
ncbi:CHAT domain-containing protein [Fulvivirga lutea]|uniref:CHAT domain-containing protein n=1 Tax=Fulvivirga lutea TaxID=2810512 RepID=A0A974WGA3_9BACT|nr:CHAT domain-containing tetratricopeptide repeat protein [Fulvivirga lutea]QSE97088.1 CHAT domain-containing protein [Fulvivirga lutea]